MNEPTEPKQGGPAPSTSDGRGWLSELGSGLRTLWALATMKVFAGIAIGLVVALLATTLPAALDDPDDLEKGTVVVLSGRDDSIDGQRGKLIEQWNALHPDTQAQIVELPAIADAQRSAARCWPARRRVAAAWTSTTST